MPSIIDKMLRYDFAVYWEPVGAMNRYGKRGFTDEPVEIKCRWEDTNEEFIGPEGERLVTSSMAFVDRDLVIGGVLWHGRLEDVDDPTKPPSNALEIKKFGKIPNLRNKKRVREAYLMVRENPVK